MMAVNKIVVHPILGQGIAIIHGLRIAGQRRNGRSARGE